LLPDPSLTDRSPAGVCSSDRQSGRPIPSSLTPAVRTPSFVGSGSFDVKDLSSSSATIAANERLLRFVRWLRLWQMLARGFVHHEHDELGEIAGRFLLEPSGVLD